MGGRNAGIPAAVFVGLSVAALAVLVLHGRTGVKVHLPGNPPPPRESAVAEDAQPEPAPAAPDDNLAANADSSVADAFGKVQSAADAEFARERAEQSEADLKRGYAQLNARWDLPPDEIEKMSTRDLLHFCVTKTSCGVMFSIHDDPFVGVRQAKKSIRVLDTAMSRPDVIDAIATICRETNPVMDQPDELAKIIGSEIGPPTPRREPSLPLMALDTILIYPDVIAKAKGREKELITLLHDRDVKIKALVARMGDEAPYALAFRMDSQKCAEALASQLNKAKLDAWHKTHSPYTARDDGGEHTRAHIDDFYAFALDEL